MAASTRPARGQVDQASARVLEVYLALPEDERELGHNEVVDRLHRRGHDCPKTRGVAQGGIRNATLCVSCARHIGDNVLTEAPQTLRCEVCTEVYDATADMAEAVKAIGNDSARQVASLGLIQLRAVLTLLPVLQAILEINPQILKGVITKSELLKLLKSAQHSLQSHKPIAEIERWQQLIERLASIAVDDVTIARVIREFIVPVGEKFKLAS